MKYRETQILKADYFPLPNDAADHTCQACLELAIFFDYFLYSSYNPFLFRILYLDKKNAF